MPLTCHSRFAKFAWGSRQNEKSPTCSRIQVAIEVRTWRYWRSLSLALHVVWSVTSYFRSNDTILYVPKWTYYLQATLRPYLGHLQRGQITEQLELKNHITKTVSIILSHRTVWVLLVRPRTIVVTWPRRSVQRTIWILRVLGLASALLFELGKANISNLKALQSIEIYSHRHNRSVHWVIFHSRKNIGCSSCLSRHLFDRKVPFCYPRSWLYKGSSRSA